jgi:hypothetical protein
MLGLGLSLLALAGCGGKAGATSPDPTPTKHPATLPVATVTPIVAATETATAQPTATVPVTATPRASATSVATVPVTSVAPLVVSAFVHPASLAPGAAARWTVTTLGDASRVQVYLSAGPGASAGPFSYELSQTADGRWSSAFTAPTAPGQYYFSIGLFNRAGHRSVIENGAWSVVVRGAASSGGAQPLPADVPLAPGFSYGNPSPATFNAVGHVISGSEVVSTTNASANGGALGQFFSVRLPRAGWTVDQSTVPAAGATSWSIVATIGRRVLVVQFSAGTLHFFYGNS